MALERVSRSDRAFLELDRHPEIVSTLGVLYVLNPGPPFEVVMAALEAYVELVPRARQHVATVNRRTLVWRDVLPFEPDSYVTRRQIGPDGTLEELLEQASLLYSRPWLRGHPMARASVIEGLEDGRSAVIIELSHAVSDGLGLLRGVQDRGASSSAAADGAAGSLLADARGYLHDVAQGTRAGLAELGQLLARATGTPASRSATRAELRSYARHMRELRAGHERGRAEPSARRAIYGFRAPVDAWADAAKQRGGGINDLFIAAAATSFLQAYRAGGNPLRALRVVMPINLRSEDDADPGNKVRRGLVRLAARDDLIDDLRPVAAASRAARERENLPVGPFAEAIQDLLPAKLASGLTRRSLAHPDFVATNLKFPVPAMQFAGADVAEHYVIGPTTGPPALFALCTYDQTAYFSLTVDPALVAHPTVLRDAFQECLDELVGTPASSA